MAFPNITRLPHVDPELMDLFTCKTTECSVGFRVVLRHLTPAEEALGVSKRQYMSYCPHHRSIYDVDHLMTYRYVSLIRMNQRMSRPRGEMLPVSRTHVAWDRRFEYDLTDCPHCQLQFLGTVHLNRHLRLYHAEPEL